MSNSGQIVGNPVTVSGGGLSNNYIFTNWQLASQNVGGDFSTINWQTYFHFNGDDAQLDNGATNWNGGALQAGYHYGFSSNFSTRDMLIGSGSFNIGHDGAGNATLALSNGIDVFQSGHSGSSGSWALPTIPRNTSITSFTVPILTDEAIRFDWSAADFCDYMSWWSTAYDGGGHHDTPTGGSNWSISLSNLQSEKTFDITVAARRADSGLWVQSGTVFPTTAKQNNYFGMRVP